MSLWSFIRDMLVFDRSFGHRKTEFFWERSQSEQQHFGNKSFHNVYNASSYSHYGHNDYAQQNFDVDQDSKIRQGLSLSIGAIFTIRLDWFSSGSIYPS